MILWIERCVDNQILVVKTDREDLYNVPLARLLEALANDSFTTFQGKQDASRKQFKQTYKRPLVFHESLILCPIYGFRSPHALFINAAAIHHLEHIDRIETWVYFHHFQKKKRVPRRILVNQIAKVEEIIGALKNKKMLT